MAKRTKKDSDKPKLEGPPPGTVIEDPENLPAEVTEDMKRAEAAPAPAPMDKTPKDEGEGPPKLRPEQEKAKKYLAGLKEPPELDKRAKAHLDSLGVKPKFTDRKPDMRAGKRPPPANQPEPALTARQFVRARKQRWERCAGFLLDMKRHLGPDARLTMKEWQPLWDAFWTRPVGGGRRR